MKKAPHCPVPDRRHAVAQFWGISDPMMQPMQMVPFMKNIAMLGAALLMTQFGSGPWSLAPRQK